MFPIRDHNPSTRTAYVTITLIALNVFVFIAGLVLLGSDYELARFYYDYAMIPQRVVNGEGYSGIVTSVFIHGGWMHLAGNMLFLWIFGDNLEEEMGHLPFFVFYMACGIGAALAQFAQDPFSPVPMVGASGAIAGVMGGYLLMFPKARVDVFIFLIVIFRILPVPAWIMLGLWFGLQLFSGVTTDPNGGGVAYWAHAGGFILGLIATIPLWLRRGGRAFWTRTDGHPPHPQAQYGRSNIPVVKRR